MVAPVIEGMLLNLLRGLLEKAIGELLKKKEVLTEVVITAIRAMVQGVSQDGIWRGQGADHFIDEMTNLVMPAAEKMVDVLSQTQVNLNSAMNDLDEADKAASQTAAALSPEFKNVYAA